MTGKRLAMACQPPARWPDLATSERELQDAVTGLAGVLGWRWVHFRPARTVDGWRTPVEGDGAGWPDLFMVRSGRIIAAELKSSSGRLSPAQDAWLGRLELAGVETHVWRPDDWRSGAIEAALR